MLKKQLENIKTCENGGNIKMKTLQDVERWLEEKEIEGSIYFTEPCYAEAIMGTDYNTNAIIYDYDKMAESLMEHYPNDYNDISEAYDFIDYNLSFGFQEDGVAPIILTRDYEFIEEQ